MATPLSRFQKNGTLAAAILGSCIVYLDSTIVTVALPRIGRDLPAHFFGVLEGQSYIYNGYLLTESAFVILAGAMLDVYGRRLMFTIGVLSFGAASILAGLAQSMESLVVFRLLQGTAGAILIPGALSLITATFAADEQGRAFGVWSGATAGIMILGPLIGGLLVDVTTWRAIFFLNVPLVLLAWWLIERCVQERRGEGVPSGFDVPGTILTAVAIGGLVFGTISGQQREWHDPRALAALGIGGAAALVLPVWMLRAPNPLVPPALFRSRNFAVTNLSTLVIYAAIAVTFYYLPLYMQGVLGYTAAAAGAATVPGTIFMVLFSARFGALASRYGGRWFMAAGPALMALGAAWLARVPAESAAWSLRPGVMSTLAPPRGYVMDFLPGVILLGLGGMMLAAPLTATLMASVPVRHAGVASAINTAISDVGPQLAGAAIFIGITATFYAALEAQVPGLNAASPMVRQQIAPLNPPPAGFAEGIRVAARSASTAAFHLAMLVSVALFIGGALINAIGIRTPVAVRPVVSADPQWRKYCHVAAGAHTEEAAGGS